MKTPEGWARANLLLATLRKPPVIGSIQEFVLRELILMKEQIDHAKLTLIVQASINASAALDTYKEYMKTAFPYLEIGKKRETESIKAIIEREIKTFGKGGIPLAPANIPKVQSKMRKTQDENANKRANKLMRKIGAVV